MTKTPWGVHELENKEHGQKNWAECYVRPNIFMFSAYLNDLTESLPWSSHRMFSDGTQPCNNSQLTTHKPTIWTGLVLEYRGNGAIYELPSRSIASGIYSSLISFRLWRHVRLKWSLNHLESVINRHLKMCWILVSVNQEELINLLNHAAFRTSKRRDAMVARLLHLRKDGTINGYGCISAKNAISTWSISWAVSWARHTWSEYSLYSF